MKCIVWFVHPDSVGETDEDRRLGHLQDLHVDEQLVECSVDTIKTPISAVSWMLHPLLPPFMRSTCGFRLHRWRHTGTRSLTVNIVADPDRFVVVP
jgi:hypothetical protein